MATNPKKSYRREKIRLQSERTQSQLDILADCLSDIFDKYSILSYKNADTNMDVYWINQRVKEYYTKKGYKFDPDTDRYTYINGLVYKPLSGIAIKNLSKSFSYDEDSEKYNSNHSRYQGTYMQKDISSIKNLIKEMTGCDIEVRHDYQELLILLK